MTALGPADQRARRAFRGRPGRGPGDVSAVTGPSLGCPVTSPPSSSAMTGRGGCRRSSSGVRRQSAASTAVVAVDTGSRDNSTELLREAFGATRSSSSRLHHLPGRRAHALAHWPRRRDAEWVWLLHDDANPDARTPCRAARRGRRAPRRRRPRPQAARVALAAAAARGRRHHLRHRPPRDRSGARGVRPGPARRGPRGARGQHRRHAGPPPRAGGARRLRRRSCRSSATTSTSAGAPPRAGHAPWSCRRRWSSTPRPRTAACGVRRSPDATPTTRSAGPRSSRCSPTSRRGGCRGRWSGCSSARLLRMLGFLLVRSVGEALDELAALLNVYWQPRAGPRRPAARGAGAAPATPRDVRHLLAPWWVPYRHGLDFVSDLAAAPPARPRTSPSGAGRRRGRRSRRRGRRAGRARPAPGRRGRRGALRTTPAWWPGSSPTRWRSR